MEQKNRPLSPHLQIYKPQITSLLSITHRMTGVFLTIGALLFSCSLIVLASGESHFNVWQTHVQSWYGQCLIYASVFSLCFHLCNGIRHLFWDVGLGLELEAVYKTGYVVIISSTLMTLLIFCLAHM